ncbi:hypothetical protein NNJEOMEG_03293 [Fundidesulfovibrio magnetotacticus]|uniref:Uncharacterized protein n=1 Tax=Fundidesulfovibrio magnetotacticus TaxID=2730080 RepID=A0A6V8LX12_9BACT|nr:hypothetical protein [Fundidesulfovibrio magnetotacticus]GFK95430.1 hypothetical protein NNJEOMEG_03293 [Fundidesulfovibrio magnetotacticus]
MTLSSVAALPYIEKCIKDISDAKIKINEALEYHTQALPGINTGINKENSVESQRFLLEIDEHVEMLQRKLEQTLNYIKSLP